MHKGVSGEMVVGEIVLHRLWIPLTVPYKLSFVELRAFDTILVEAHDGDGRVGVGKATLLTGYTEESATQSCDLACRLCRHRRLLPTMAESENRLGARILPLDAEVIFPLAHRAHAGKILLVLVTDGEGRGIGNFAP